MASRPCASSWARTEARSAGLTAGTASRSARARSGAACPQAYMSVPPRSAPASAESVARTAACRLRAATAVKKTSGLLKRPGLPSPRVPSAASGRRPTPSASAQGAAQGGDALLEHGGRHLRGRNGLAAHALDARPDAPERPAHGPPVLAAEEAAPEAAQRHGNHGRRGARDDALDAGTEGTEIAVRREPALGKDADQAPLLERARHRIERLLDDLRVLPARRDRDRAHRAAEEIEDRQEEVVVA